MARTKTRQVTIIRRVVQAAFGLGLIGTSIAHNLIAEQAGTAMANPEALCPFGRLNTAQNICQQERPAAIGARPV
jgi:hypothetical protein